MVPWCGYTKATGPKKSIFEYTWADMRRQFHTVKSCNTHCTIGCARRVSRMDGWRTQNIGRTND